MIPRLFWMVVGLGHRAWCLMFHHRPERFRALRGTAIECRCGEIW